MKFILALILLLVSVLPAWAAPQYGACARLKNFQTDVAVDLQLPDPAYLLGQTKHELNVGKDKEHRNWIDKNGMQTLWRANEMETLGQAAGGWALLSQEQAMAIPYDTYGTSYCPYFKKITISMMYRTLITIPKDFPTDTCGFNIIRTHELRHHAVNVGVVRAMVARLQKDLPEIIAQIETSSSYVPRPQVKLRFKQMQDDLEAALKIYLNESIQQEMQRLNAQIDTPQEYAASGKAIRDCR